MMRMAAVGASALTAEDELAPWLLVDMVALLSCAASLLTRTTALFRPGSEKLRRTEQKYKRRSGNIGIK